MKQFLRESPAIWALIALALVLVLLGFAVLGKNWAQCVTLALLLFWILVCIKKDYIIWKLTKGDKE